jgi:F-type H+-transporting ATPase subunit b
MLAFPPDISFFIQIASFVILWVGLKRLLFDPVLHLLEQREARTAGAYRDASNMKAAADTSAAEYERRMQEVRLSVAADTEAARTATHTQEQRVVSEARAQASTQLTQLRESLARQAAAARPALGSEARELAAQIVERVVGRPLA